MFATPRYHDSDLRHPQHETSLVSATQPHCPTLRGCCPPIELVWQDLPSEHGDNRICLQSHTQYVFSEGAAFCAPDHGITRWWERYDTDMVSMRGGPGGCDYRCVSLPVPQWTELEQSDILDALLSRVNINLWVCRRNIHQLDTASEPYIVFGSSL